MKLFPAYFGKRDDDDSAPMAEPENESRADIFNLIPPRASDKYLRPDGVEPSAAAAPERAEGRHVHAVNAMDLSRLSIDDDGRLYWDGKPVEVRRRLSMSPAQIVGVSVVAVFVAIGAIGSVLQATASVHEWSCRIGLTSYCAPAAAPAPEPPARVDIPA